MEHPARWRPLSVDRLTSYCRCRARQLEPPALEKFVLWNDRDLYDKDIGRAYLTDRAQLRLFNASSSLEQLHAALATLNLADSQRLRPGWDQYFMQLASLAAQRSNCMKRRVGCVIVRERRVISTGYNGTPRHLKNCNEGGCMVSLPASYLADRHRPKMQPRRRRWCRLVDMSLHPRRGECAVGGWTGAYKRRLRSLLRHLPLLDVHGQDRSGWNLRGCIFTEL